MNALAPGVTAIFISTQNTPHRPVTITTDRSTANRLDSPLCLPLFIKQFFLFAGSSTETHDA